MSDRGSGRPDDGGDDPREGRIEVLEAAEDRRSRSDRLDRRFELTEAILLSIAALLAAWAGFQSAKWSGDQADQYSRAGASRVEATAALATAGQQSTVDVISFTQWLAAAEREGLLAGSIAAGEPYESDDELLSGFLYQRFRPEFGAAVDAWLETLDEANPAPTPFVMPEYRLAAQRESDRLHAEAEAHSAAARQSNERSDTYVLMTIMFATVLFFAGISSKMDTVRARVFLLGTGMALLGLAIVIVAALPKEL